MGDIFGFTDNLERGKNGFNQLGDGLKKVASGIVEAGVGKLQMDAAALSMLIDTQPAVMGAKLLLHENKDRLPSGGALAAGVGQEAARVANKVVDHVKNRPATSVAELTLLPPLFVADALISPSASKPKPPEVKNVVAESKNPANPETVKPQSFAKPIAQPNSRFDTVDAKKEGRLEPEIVPKVQAEYPDFKGKDKAKSGPELSQSQSKRDYDGIAEAKKGPLKAKNSDDAASSYKPFEEPEKRFERSRRAKDWQEEKPRRRNQQREDDRQQMEAREIDKAVQTYEQSLRASLPKKMAHHIPEMTQAFKTRLLNEAEKGGKDGKQGNGATRDGLSDGKPKSSEELEAARINNQKGKEIAPVKDVLSAAQFEETTRKFKYNESTYGQALQEAADKGKPIVLIAGTKDSAGSFLKDAGADADARKGDAVYVFVSRDKLSKDNVLAQYLDNQVGRDHSSNSQYCFASVFRVTKDAAGALSNAQPEFASSGSQAFKREQIQSAVARVERIAQSERNRYQAVESVPQPYYQPQPVIVSEVQPSYQVPFQQYQYQPQPTYTQPRGLPILRRFR